MPFSLSNSSFLSFLSVTVTNVSPHLASGQESRHIWNPGGLYIRIFYASFSSVGSKSIDLAFIEFSKIFVVMFWLFIRVHSQESVQKNMFQLTWIMLTSLRLRGSILLSVLQLTIHILWMSGQRSFKAMILYVIPVFLPWFLLSFSFLYW